MGREGGDAGGLGAEGMRGVGLGSRGGGGVSGAGEFAGEGGVEDAGGGECRCQAKILKKKEKSTLSRDFYAGDASNE